MFRFFSCLGFFGAPTLVLITGTIALAFSQVFGPFNPDKVDRATLIRAMQLRDFRTFSPDALRRTTDRAESEFGRKSAQKPVFEFSSTEKKVYAYFQEGRAGNPEKGPSSHFETNLLLMARLRYFQWMNDYEAFSDEQRKALMNEIADDMKYWQSVYMDFLRAADLPIPSIQELIREFEQMIDRFKVDATPDEVARIDSFKQKMNQAIVARELGGAVRNLSGTVSSTVSGVFSTFLGTPKKKNSNPIDESTKPARDSQNTAP